MSVIGASGKCMDVEYGGTADGTPVQIHPCNETKAQQWRLTGDTVRALDKCLTTSGTKLVLATCDGSDKQKFVHRAGDKSLNNPATNQCVDVPNNAADGTDLQLWPCNATGPQQFTFDNTTTYVYDAGGNRLIEETGSSRTLYLGEAEITVNKAGQAVDAVRYYSGAGATTVRRTSGRADNHQLTVQLADHHGTATTSVEQTAGQAISRRKSDPYGNPRGTQPANWTGSRGFLGSGIDDTNTGLTHIGAREYEATTGRFISVDPVIDITNPTQMNGYTYASGNPVNKSDPSGLIETDCKNGHCGGHYNPRDDDLPVGHPNRPTPIRGDYNSAYTEQDKVAKPYYGSRAGTGPSVSKSSKPKKAASCSLLSLCSMRKAVDTGKKFWHENKIAIVSIATEIVVGVACIAAAGAAGVATGGVGFAAAAGCGAIAGAAGAAVANYMNPNADHSILGSLKDMATGALWGAAGGVLGAAAGPVLAAAGKAIGKGVGQVISKIAGKGGCATRNSFAAGTLVVMADGSSKPIDDLKPGDNVLATDPETGETAAKDVTATILGEGIKNLVEVTVDTDGDAGTATDLITATDGHPFWAVDLAKWVDATDLQPGQWLRTSAGTHVQVSALKRWTTQATVHNLTVADLHTYYVLAGTTPILVHNCGGSFTIPGKKWVNSYGGDIGQQGIEATYDYGVLEMVVRAPKGVEGLPRGSRMIRGL
ncbi:ricin-type beta-trefoil lectin domain protein [Streptomyces sp. NPDC058734]|uniref:ricin-type beta-trefoil lectin domain protein n=1 Tax=Streptomyces sp. NPDC058734 TaxID=3346615 RepID=UPI0036CC49FC